MSKGIIQFLGTERVLNGFMGNYFPLNMALSDWLG